MSTAFLISDLHIDHYLGSSPSRTGIKKLLKPHLCDADVLVVAGDISNHVKSSAKTIEVLAEMYQSVVWTTGNHDMVSYNGENSVTKIDRLVKSVTVPNAHYMNGIPVTIGATTFGGSMGYCDFSYSEKHFGISKDAMTEQWRMNWYDGRYWNIGGKQPLDVWAEEYSKLSDCVSAGANVMVSHIGPAANNVHPRYHNPYTGFFYFDGLNLLNQMPEGSVWCFGHTHDYFDMKVGNVRLLCNPFGYRDEIRNTKIPKEQFLFTV
jgi:predicted phosphodiesterase